jgi:alanine racemase
MDRRRFLAISAGAAAMGATRFGWSEAEAGAAEAASAAGDRTVNDYLVLQVSASALKANLTMLRRELKPTTRFCFVAKANCFGHGWLQCKAAVAHLADWVAVATPMEALAVRKSGWQRPLLLLMASGFPGETAAERLRQLISLEVTLTLASPADLPLISAAASAVGRPAQVHVKVDSGMTRSGVLPANTPALVRQAKQQTGVEVTGIYTHFAAADERDKTSAREQLARFMGALRACGNDTNGLIRHAAASAATIDLPESHLDMVRVGTAAYGHQPSDEMTRKLPLKGAMRLVGRLTQVKDVPAGSYVSYGRTYRFEKAAKIGLVPIGYTDGYWRAFSNRAVMRIDGRPAPVRGRVCMDQTIIDLTGMPHVKVGDEVEIVSPDAEAPNSVENLARLAGTIAPDVMVRFGGQRIRRVAVS